MNTFITKFACTPFLNPPPPDPRVKTTTLHPHETLMTLFEEFDSPFIEDRYEKQRMFNSLENNLPLICNFQAEKMPGGAESNKYCGSVSLFMHYLSDPSAHPYSLCPIPQFENLKLEEMIKYCLDSRIPPNRAVWGIHHFINRTKLTPEEVTAVLTNTTYHDQTFFSRLCAAIYRANLIQHIPFINWAIKNIEPENLLPFEKDFISTHCILYNALLSDKYEKYIDLLRIELLKSQSHLVQFAVICEFNKQVFEEPIFSLITDKNMIGRVRYIYELILPSELMYPCTETLDILIPKVIFENYPKFDFEKILYEIKRSTHFAKQFDNFALTICKSLLHFNSLNNEDYINISALIAWLIKQLGFILPISEFVTWVYEMVDKINVIKYLFYELQYQKIIKYQDFLIEIRRRGYFLERFEESAKIFAEFPSLDRSNECLGRIYCTIRRIFPNIDFLSQCKAIGNDFIGNVDIIQKFPYVMKFEMAYFLIYSENGNLKQKAQFLTDINVEILLPELSINKKSNQYTKSNRNTCQKNLQNIKLNGDPNTKQNHKQNSSKNVINVNGFVPKQADKLKTLYEAHGLKEIIKSIPENYSNAINFDNFITLIQKYSYLCSLHVYDAAFSVRYSPDLESLLTVFFQDLMQFKALNYSQLSSFFSDFNNLKIVSHSPVIFVKTFLTCYLKYHHEKAIKDTMYQFISNHFVDFLRKSIIKPMNYLLIIFSIIKDDENINPQLFESLINNVFDVIDENSDIYEVNDCLNNEVVEGFYSSKVSNAIYLYHSYLTRLRSLKPPELHSIPTGNYIAALFSLLPTELFSDDIDSLFCFFQTHLSKQTIKLWSLWLRDRPKYQPGFPVTLSDSSESEKNRYVTRLVDAFSDISTPLLKESWWILCENKAIANAVIYKSINESAYNIDYLHPALLSADESIYERLCEKMRNVSNIYDDFMKVASATFIIFIFRFASSQDLTINIADRLLEWMNKLIEKQSRYLITVIDTFNFLICWTIDPLSTQESQKTFQDNLHNTIQANLKKLPNFVKKKIILNRPRQMYKNVSEPMFADLVAPDNDAGTQFQLHSNYNEGNDSSGYLGWISTFDEVDQLFWT
ncbi:hypothetical protein TRFO_38510 [Tritrichomonas foetus]|uniref:Uncharacterized protein n=1 Tax=Tritrichomonas foetus TaxID=1144522 RepID=A0A1J4J9M5_9EUKA|nr:hypothetical protein TRFO_38510 [Tritrichomonas foetus]|eukprot:OHS95369.1 hypothetical protein TRFO_38510 [Tritrichomonas foetus]